jgi:YjbE family integral membrane protein
LNLGVYGSISLDWAFVSALLSIVVIDLILAGDNAVVIAMAVRSLPSSQRRRGILVGAGAAVVLRVLATFFVSQMLRIQFIKLVGGALILWIAVKLFVEGAPEDGLDRDATNLWQAIRIIVIADITMSLDNMLAVAGVSQGNLFLLLFGLGLSIPFVVFTSNLLAMLMDKYPTIIYLGAAILGRVGGEMMITDPVMESWLHPNKAVVYAVEALFAVGVIVVGKIWVRQMIKAERNRHGAFDATEVTLPEREVE